MGECPDGDCLLDSCFVDCAADGLCPAGFACLDGFYCIKSCTDAAECGVDGCCWQGSCMSPAVCAGSSEGVTCLGHCGGHASSGCFCNANCVYYDDCCADRAAVCGQTGSCAGACGGQSADGCFCDTLCEGVGNCCPDYAAICL